MNKSKLNKFTEKTFMRATVGEGTYIKGAMEAAEKDFGPPFPPQRALSKEEIAELRKIMEEADIIEEWIKKIMATFPLAVLSPMHQ